MATAVLDPPLTLSDGDADVCCKERERSSRRATFLQEKVELWRGRRLCGRKGRGVRHDPERDFRCAKEPSRGFPKNALVHR